MTEPRFLRNDREPSTLDQVTAERLLDGHLDRRSLPPGYAAVLDLIDAARAPAAVTELVGEHAALASFRARHRYPSRSPHPSRRGRVLSKVLTIKAAVVAAGALTVAGAAAAATGSLPGSGAGPTVGAATHSSAATGSAAAGATAGVDRTARIALCEAVARRGRVAEAAPAAAALARLAGGAAAVEAYCAEVGSTTKPDTPADRGPDATGAARAGLCRALAAGGEGERGGRESSVAFEALALAAGGAGKVEAYCAVTGTTGAADQAADGKPSTRLGSAPTATPSHPGPPESLPGGQPTDPPAAVPSPGRQSGRP